VTRTTCDKIANRKPDDDQAQGVKNQARNALANIGKASLHAAL
jgi:hypothetical protein